MDCVAAQTESACESGLLRTAEGTPLRPGGVALTERAMRGGRWRPGELVMDLGCGGGTSLRLLAAHGLAAIGVDLSHAALQQARQGGAGWLTQADAASLPFSRSSMHGVLAECSLSLMPDKVLTELWCVLARGGRLVVTDLYRRGPSCDVAAFLPRCLAGLMSAGEWQVRLASRHFALQRWEDHSDVLGAFMAQFIFAQCDSGRSWFGDPCDAIEASRLRQAIRVIRPGYMLFVASKEGHDDG